MRQLQEEYPEVKIFYFAGSYENTLLVESCVKMIMHYQDNYPDEPIKIWISSVPKDDHDRNIVARNLMDGVRREFFEAPFQEDAQLYN